MNPVMIRSVSNFQTGERARSRRSRLAAGRPNVASTGAKEFPPFRLDAVNQCLWRRRDGEEDQRVLLTPKAFAVLRYLVEHAGRLVTQNELLDAVWPDTFVQPEVLKYQIADIRRVLGDHPKDPLFIETLPRRGYRFIAAVKDGEAAESAPTPTLDQSQPADGGRDLDALRDCLQKAFEGHRQVVFITGEPGIAGSNLESRVRKLHQIHEALESLSPETPLLIMS